jgi:mannose-6-phosphate isomerase-like protein (cupin superfamily)
MIRWLAGRKCVMTHTEIYLILEGEGHVELDGELVPVRPFSTVLIKPLCRHRAVGRLRIVNLCIPPLRPGRRVV